MKTEVIRNELIEVVWAEVSTLLVSDVQGHIVQICRDAGTEFHRTLHMVLRTAWLVQNGNGITPNDNWQ